MRKRYKVLESGRKKPLERRKLGRRDFLHIISGDAIRSTLGSGPDELSVVKLLKSSDVIVDEERCTLCGACAYACKKKALFVEVEGEELLLKFDQSLCDGCPVCEEKCPEDAIKVIEVKRKENKVMPKASSKVAFCRSCGVSIGSVKAIEKVASLLKGKGMDAYLDMLYLCPACKGRASSK